MSLIAVPILAATGMVNSFFLVGSFSAFTGTPYGRLLLIKLSLFLAMLFLGAWNLLFLKPKIAPPAAQDATDAIQAARSLQQSVLLELFLGTLIVLVVALLGITEPAIYRGFLSNPASPPCDCTSCGPSADACPLKGRSLREGHQGGNQPDKTPNPVVNVIATGTNAPALVHSSDGCVRTP